MQAPVLLFDPVGSPLAFFKVNISGTINAAFLPENRDQPRGYAAEIAAYRLARCLGIANVPPSVSRQFREKAIGDKLNPSAAFLWAVIRERVSLRDDGIVRGAFIYWIPAMRYLRLGKSAILRDWSTWLKNGGELPDDRRMLAADISTMIAFDYLIGNPGRLNGENIHGDSEGARLYFRDHDLAFPRRLSNAVHLRFIRQLTQVERFSRELWRRLRELTPETLNAELNKDPESARRPLLDERQIHGLFDRRDAVVSHIGSLISLHGEDRVLVFP